MRVTKNVQAFAFEQAVPWNIHGAFGFKLSANCKPDRAGHFCVW